MPTRLRFSLLLVALACAFSPSASAQSRVVQATKITEGAGGFTGDLDAFDQFGTSVASLGDVNGDGVEDMAVGANWDDDGGGFDKGAVWILFLNADGTVGAQQKISATEGGFDGPLETVDNFGESVSAIGDLDGDGVVDLAVGAPGTNVGKGAVWILFLNTDGTVRAEQKIGEGVGGFTGELTDADSFGEGVTPLGDLDGDGVTELAVGAPLDDDGGSGSNDFTNRGAVWMLFLNADGTVRTHRKISQTRGGFTGVLREMDNFGKDVCAIGDVDGNGVSDLAVGAWADQDGGALYGAVWIVFLNADATVSTQQKISATEGGFTGQLSESDFFGVGVGTVGDLDGDGVPDVAVGAFNDDEGAFNTGAVWLLYLNTDGTVKGHFKISNTTAGFEGRLGQDDLFGAGVDLLGDLDGDGLPELAVGANFDSDVETGAGAAWVLSLDIAQDAAALAVTLEPTDPPVVIPAEGGSFTFTFSITNTSAEAQTFDAWTEATYPDGRMPVALGPVAVMLAPGESATRTLVQRVPASLPAGAYTYTGYAGAFPDGAVASAGFMGAKAPARLGRDTAAATRGASAWVTFYADGGAPVAPGDVWTADGPTVVAQSSVASGQQPGTLVLEAPSPNPLSSQATVGFSLTEASAVRLAVYDVLGREVAVLVDGTLGAGRHQAVLTASGLPSGSYVVRLEAGSRTATHRVAVVR